MGQAGGEADQHRLRCAAAAAVAASAVAAAVAAAGTSQLVPASEEQTPVSGSSSWTVSAASRSPARAATTERTCS